MAGVVALVVLAAACQPWPQWMGNTALTGDDTGEGTITTANVATLQQVSTVPVGTDRGSSVFPPTVANGMVFAATMDDLSGQAVLVAASASPTGSGCGGSPTSCAPLWAANLGKNLDDLSAPTVASGVVYENATDASGHGELAAFDESGVTNCSGTPVMCQPLWTAATEAVWAPNVVDGKVFVASLSGLQVYDAAGSTNCTGTPKVCTPLWTSTSLVSWSEPSVAGSKVYVTDRTTSRVDVFDENGVTNCSGAPAVCAPLFSVVLPTASAGSVAVAGTTGYVGASSTVGYSGSLTAFDATGVTNCSGAPVVCQPLWTASIPGLLLASTPAVVGGRVYVASEASSGHGTLDEFDAAGSSGCSGTPVVCTPLVVADSGAAAHYEMVGPTVTAHLVFAGGQAYDTAASAGCNGSAPTVCTHLWSVPNSAYSSTAVSNGRVYIGGDDGLVHVYALPAS